MSNSRNRGDSNSNGEYVRDNTDRQTPEDRNSPKSPYVVKGEGGKARHAGYFNSNNPYFTNLDAANNNQDKDALYELAIQWEADYANRQMQLEENRAILEEQRWYDNPVNQMARQRLAGINPDLGGSGSGSSSGSSAQLANPAMADQSGQTNFSNQYDNANMIMDGINTAMNVMNTMSTVASTVGNLFDTFSTLGGRKELTEAQANLANAQAEALPQQIAIQEKQAGIQDASQQTQAQAVAAEVAAKNVETANKQISGRAIELGNISTSLKTVAELAKVITPNMNADQKASMLNVMGIPQDKHKDYLSAIEAAQANPAISSQYYADQVSNTKNKAENSVVTAKLASSVIQTEYDVKLAQGNLAIAAARLDNSVKTALFESGYADDLADQMSEEAKARRSAAVVNQEQLKLAKKQVERDAQAFVNQLNFCKKQYQLAEKEIKKIKENAKDRKLTVAEEAAISNYTNRMLKFGMLGTQALGQAFQDAQNLASSIYMSKTFLTRFGGVENVAQSSNEFTFNNISFMNYLQGDVTDQAITQKYIQSTLGFLGNLVSGKMFE